MLFFATKRTGYSIAVLQTSEYIQNKYSQSIYGKNATIKSLNFEDGWVRIQKDEHGNLINPFKLLPSLFEGVEETEDFLTNNQFLDNGGAAMTAYMKMQFTNISQKERNSIISRLTSLLRIGYLGNGYDF